MIASVEGERHVREEQFRQAFRQVALVADRGNVDRDEDGDRGERDDRDEGRRDYLGEARHHNHDDDPDGDERVDHKGHAEQLRKLRGEDQNCQRVDESDHDASRDEAHELRDTDGGQDDLEDSAQNDGRDEVIQAILTRQRCDDERDRSGGSRDHRGPAADERDHNCHHEGGEQPDARVDAGDDRERNGLGDEGQCHHEPG